MTSVQNLLKQTTRTLTKQSYFQKQYQYLLNTLNYQEEELKPNELYQEIIKNFDKYMQNLDNEDQMKVIYYLGIHNYRKKYFAISQQHAITTLKRLRGEKLQLSYEDLVQIVLSLGNQQIHDKQIMNNCLDECRKHNFNMELHQLLSLQWAFMKLGYRDQKIMRIFKQSLYNNQDERKLYHYIRICWLYSLIPYFDIGNHLINLINKANQLQSIEYTPKDSYYIVQTLFNIYPEMLDQIRNSQPNLFALSTNKYAKYFNDLYIHYDRSIQVIKNNLLSLQQSNQQYNITYQKQKDGKYQTKVKLSQNLQNPNKSKFERYTQENLQKLPYSFETNQYCSIYEIDFIIENKIILETNGVKHIIRDIDKDYSKEKTLSHQLKIKHLQQMGYNKIIELDFKEWQMVDPRSKQLIKLRTLIEEQLQKF